MPELIDVVPGNPEWLAARRQGVTATDIVIILGLSSYDSAYSLYWRKLGQVPDKPDNDRFRLGRELEPYVWERWLEQSREFRVQFQESALYRHSDRDWQLATLDRRGRECVVELKTWADADRHSWSDGPPASVRAQVLWQMDVMDVGTGHVGVVFLPSGEFRSYVIEHASPAAQKAGMNDPAAEDIGFMRERGAEFYARLQGELPPPDIDASAASLAAVKARFGDARKDKTVTVDGDLWAHYSASCDWIDEWTASKRKWENKIREQVGEAGAIEVDGQLVARRLVYDAQVKAHTRHVDSIRRVKQAEGED